MSTPDEIFAAADALSTEDKWTLVTRLWATLPSEGKWMPNDSDLAILDQRMAEYDAGLVEAIPATEVRRRIRERLASYG